MYGSLAVYLSFKEVISMLKSFLDSKFVIIVLGMTCDWGQCWAKLGASSEYLSSTRQ